MWQGMPGFGFGFVTSRSDLRKLGYREPCGGVISLADFGPAIASCRSKVCVAQSLRRQRELAVRPDSFRVRFLFIRKLVVA